MNRRYLCFLITTHPFLFYCLWLSWMLGAEQGKAWQIRKLLVDFFLYLEIVSILYLYLEVFILLHEPPSHFHVKKGMKSTELPYQREKRILVCWDKVSHHEEKHLVELSDLLNFQYIYMHVHFLCKALRRKVYTCGTSLPPHVFHWTLLWLQFWTPVSTPAPTFHTHSGSNLLKLKIGPCRSLFMFGSPWHIG